MARKPRKKLRGKGIDVTPPADDTVEQAIEEISEGGPQPVTSEEDSDGRN